MIEEKELFESYLKEMEPENTARLLGVFEHYHKLLVKHNKGVNLISRKMPANDYWVQHFLDSLRAMEILDFTGKIVLDFGTGGGLPGIPLKIFKPDFSLVLLDSIQKKCRVVQEMVEALSLSDTAVACARMEDYAYTPRRPSFDLILCRAVALEERYFSPLRRLLKPSGRLILYKAQSLDDLAGLKYEILYEKEDEKLGLRRLIAISQRDLMIR